MNGVVINILGALIIAGILLGLYLCRKEGKRKAAAARKPHRVPSPIQSRMVVAASSVRRLPRSAEDMDYLTYRNCPDCHSENTKASQVIFKIGAHDFVCHACGCRFRF